MLSIKPIIQQYFMTPGAYANAEQIFTKGWIFIYVVLLPYEAALGMYLST